MNVENMYAIIILPRRSRMGGHRERLYIIIIVLLLGASDGAHQKGRETTR